MAWPSGQATHHQLNLPCDETHPNPSHRPLNRTANMPGTLDEHTTKARVAQGIEQRFPKRIRVHSGQFARPADLAGDQHGYRVLPIFTSVTVCRHPPWFATVYGTDTGLHRSRSQPPRRVPRAAREQTNDLDQCKQPSWMILPTITHQGGRSSKKVTSTVD